MCSYDSSRFCGGLWLDIKRKAPWFCSDLYEGFHVQSISAVLFIYLGCITNAITFGGLLGDATDNYQGVMESFLGTALAGTVFCLFGGQPLIILSSTGPILIFEKLLYEFSKSNDIDYMELRLCIGLHSCLQCFVLVATDASYIINKKKCVQYGGSLVGGACKYVPDLALMSFILFFGTYSMTVSLKKFKSSRYFPTMLRKLISDFAIFMSIMTFVGLDMLVGLDTPKLIVPTEIKISAVIVNRKENKLKKGGGYHLDLLWVGVLMAVCSFMGLPWYVAATVISIAHIDSLKMESESSAPGEQPQFLGVR
ncbi:hypothetical protein CRUP_026119 [Coryphaenoides rupestris]|nr:hypothetical protein CRUP_026119 [Coryphaenoides rupestris]